MRLGIARVLVLPLLVCSLSGCRTSMPQKSLDACAKWPDPMEHIVPIWRVDPFYPGSAKRQGIGGFVDVEFLIDREGRVRSPQVVGSEPPGVFDRASLNALGQWRYCPLSNGLEDYPDPVKVRLQFEPGEARSQQPSFPQGAGPGSTGY